LGLLTMSHKFSAPLSTQIDKMPLRVYFRLFLLVFLFKTAPTPSAFAERVLLTLEKVYEGKDVSVDFSLASEHLSSFRRKVLDATFKIPVGYVTSYGQLADAASGSPRAVGHVMATNPLAPIVPCHRVVAADFTLGGYGGGLKVKLEFLRREKRGFETTQEIPLAGGALRVFPVEFVLDKLTNCNI